MFISGGSRKCSEKSRKRERPRRLQKLNLRKGNPSGRKQRNKTHPCRLEHESPDIFSDCCCACLDVVPDSAGRGLAAVPRASREWCRSRGQSAAPLGTDE